MDSSSLRFLTTAALRQRKEEEEMDKERVKRQQAQIIVEALRVQERTRELLRRKRKKRKKRLPRTSSSPSRKLWRRLDLPSSCACLPTSGTTSSFCGVWVFWCWSSYPLCVGHWLRQHSANSVLCCALLLFGVKVATFIWTCLSSRAGGGVRHCSQGGT